MVPLPHGYIDTGEKCDFCHIGNIYQKPVYQQGHSSHDYELTCSHADCDYKNEKN